MRILLWLDQYFEETITALLMSVMSVIICLQVVTRYFLETSLAWSEELARYMFIWMIYTGISCGVKKRKHICVDALYNLLPVGKGRMLLAYVGDALFLFFTLFVLNRGVEVFLRIVASGQHSPACELPMWVVYGALPFGMALSSFRLLQGMCRRYKEEGANKR